MSKLFIGPYKTGLQLNLEPWLINQEAFTDLFNAYIWRGRVKKKQGIEFLSRLQRLGGTLPDALGNTVAPHTTFTGTIAVNNRPISPGTVTITAGALTFTDNGNGTLTSPAVNSNYGTIDYETGVVNLFFNPALGGITAVIMTAGNRLPRLPVMGIGTREQDPINQEQTLAFDTTYSYEFNQGNQQFRDVSFYKMAAPQNAVTWHGSNSDFFWTTNYYRVANRNIFWETNNVVGDHQVQLTAIANDAGNVQFTLGAGHPYVIGDVVYLDEISLPAASGYNGLTGTVTASAATTITLDINFIVGSAGLSNGRVFALTRTISGDGIKYYDGFGVGFGWRNFQPPLQQYTATVTPNYLLASLILIPYKNRLLAFNTTEGPAGGAFSTFRNRVRWSQNGTPFYATSSTPPAAGTNRTAGTSWMDDIVGHGGYIDAPTTEAIVSIALYKDTCIVFFERSTWQLRYTGEELLPFVWERINEQMGAESTFSPIYFDDGVLAVGDKGIVAANSISVERIDEYIPDLVYQIHNTDEGTSRVHGIRDFQRKVSYWTYPTDDFLTIFPNRILAYNYDDKAYSIFDNSHTCFGTLQSSSDITWESIAPWSSLITWQGIKSQSFYPHIIAGNQIGFVHIFDTDLVSNQISLDLMTSVVIPNSISNTNPPVVQVINHNLQSGQFVRILDTKAFPINVVAEASGTATAGSTSFSGTLANVGVFTGSIQITVGANTFTDLGNGTLAGGAGGSTIEYDTGIFILNFAALAIDTAVTSNYTYNLLNFRVFKINVLSANTFSLIINPFHDFTIYPAYTGSGSLEVIDNFNLRTKLLNPFLNNDMETRINYLNAYLTTDNMDFTLNTYGDDNSTIILDSLTVSNSNYYNIASDKTWNRIYPNVTSQFFQLEFTMNDTQMLDYDNINNDFELHAMILDVNEGARLR